jgi:hypothetical protein
MTQAIFTVGSIILVVALLPSILGPDKPAVWTSALVASVLWWFTGAYAIGLHFVCAGVTSGVAATGWTILLCQAIARETKT